MAGNSRGPEGVLVLELQVDLAVGVLVVLREVLGGDLAMEGIYIAFVLDPHE